MPLSQPIERESLPALRVQGLAVVGPAARAPAPPDPPHQPRLRGVAEVAVIRDPTLPPRLKRARFLFRHPRRPRLEQLLVLHGVLFPFAISPVPLQAHFVRRSRKLPVIPSHGKVAPESRQALADVSDGDEPDLKMPQRPRTRGECAGQPRPCPWVGCQHHLYLDVHPTSGAIRLNHPGVALEDMVETCCLDVAERGVSSLSLIAEHLGISHERVRQIEVAAGDSFAVAHAQANRLPGKPLHR
jgi:hypothetical protein